MMDASVGSSAYLASLPCGNYLFYCIIDSSNSRRARQAIGGMALCFFSVYLANSGVVLFFSLNLIIRFAEWMNED